MLITFFFNVFFVLYFNLYLDLNPSKLCFACKEQSLRQIAISTKERQLLVSLVVDYSTAKLTDISRF